MFGLIPYTNRIATRDNSFMNPFNDDFFRAFFDRGMTAPSFRVDVKDDGDHYTLKADLPGVEKENVKVSVDDGVMTITADISENKEDSREGYVYRERRRGSLRRSFDVSGISEEAITAEYKDGVLTLNMPKLEEPAPKAREIAIN